MEMIKPSKPPKNSADAQQARCIDVLRRGKILHLGMLHDPDADNYPYVFPLVYGFDFKEEAVIYMHLGYRPDNPRLKALTKHPYVYFSVEADVRVVPFQFNPCMSTVRYFGVEGRGTIKPLCYRTSETSKKEVRYALNVMMHQITGQYEDHDYLTWDFNEDLMKKLVVLKLTISEYAPTDHAYAAEPSKWTPPDECQTK